MRRRDRARLNRKLPATFGSLCVLATMAAFLGSPTPGSAVKVEHILGGVTNVVFFDNFENDIIGNSPFFPQVGSWVQPGGGFDPVITNAFPGPADAGTRYLQLTRLTGNAPNDGAQFTSSINSGVLSATFYVFLTNGSPDFTMEVGLSTTGAAAGYPNDRAYLVNQGGFASYLNPAATGYISTGVPIQFDKWQAWKINYSFNPGVNDDSFTVSVDGITSAVITRSQAHNATDSALSFLGFSGGANNTTWYVDGVPEPGTIGLVALGLFTLLRVRFAKRR